MFLASQLSRMNKLNCCDIFKLYQPFFLISSIPVGYEQYSREMFAQLFRQPNTTELVQIVKRAEKSNICRTKSGDFYFYQKQDHQIRTRRGGHPENQFFTPWAVRTCVI